MKVKMTRNSVEDAGGHLFYFFFYVSSVASGEGNSYVVLSADGVEEFGLGWFFLIP